MSTLIEDSSPLFKPLDNLLVGILNKHADIFGNLLRKPSIVINRTHKRDFGLFACIKIASPKAGAVCTMPVPSSVETISSLMTRKAPSSLKSLK